MAGAAAQKTESLLTPEEVQHYLGIGRTSTYLLLSQGTIPSVRVGRLRRIRPSDLERYIEEHLEQPSLRGD